MPHQLYGLQQIQYANARAKGTYHEVTLDEVELVRETLLGGVVCRTINLVVVVVQASDVAAGKLGNLASRAANTTADIEDFHALFDADRVCEVVLVSGNGLEEGLAIREATKVEGLAPAILVKIGREVVVARSSCQDLLHWRAQRRRRAKPAAGRGERCWTPLTVS